MPLSITPESKNTLTITNKNKNTQQVIYNEADVTWDEGYPDTWNGQSLPLVKETKNTITITNETKN